MSPLLTCTCQYWCDANDASCAKQWPKCQNKAPKHVPSQCNKIFIKNLLQKGPENEKKFGLSRDWTHSWAGYCFVYVVLTGMYHSYWRLFPVFPLHQCLQCTVKDEQKQISNIFEFLNDVRLILLKSRFNAYLECKVTVLSKLNSLYLPYVQELFMMTNHGNFTTCTCSSIH